MALLATVLLCTTAATIALVVLRQATATGRFEVYRRGSDDARVAAEAAIAAFEGRLELDPVFFLSQVWEGEPARVCTVPGESSAVVQPGASWPAACGTAWDYVEPATTAPSYVFVEPPAPGDDRLLVTAVARTSAGRYGVEVGYRPTDAGRWTVWTQDALDLGWFAQGDGATAALTGGLYAVGPVTLDPAVTVSGAQVVSEASPADAFVGTPAAGTWWYAGGGLPSADPQVLPVRQAVPVPGDAVRLGEGVEALASAACPSGVGQATPGTLCLAEQVAVTTSAGAVVTPAAADDPAWLLVFGASGPGTVDVWMADKALDVCPPSSGLVAWSAPLVAAGLHPGSVTFWDQAGSSVPGGYGCVRPVGAGGAGKVGVFDVPASGLVGVRGDVVVGLCGAGFAAADGVCTSWSGSSGTVGMQVDTAVTVAVTAPGGGAADVYVGGPVAVAGAARLAVATTGAVVVPYWSSPPGDDLDVAVHVAAADVDAAPDGSFRFSPALSVAPVDESDRGGTVTFTGRLAVARFADGVAAARWDGFVLVPDRAVPAWLPSPAPGVERTGAVRVRDPEITALLAGLVP